MLRYAALRLVLAVPTLAGVLLLVSLLLQLVPGDPVDVMLGEGAATVDREQLRHAMGLDRPAWRQLADFVAGAAHGDLGRSIAAGEPVATLLAQRYPATLELTGAALLVALLIALPLGCAAAIRPGSPADRTSLVLATLETALPTFCLGPLLILVFAVELPWLPVSGRDGASSVVLPALTLGFGMSAVLARQLRVALAAALRLDCVRTARAKGARPWRAMLLHALPNAATATTTVLGLQLGGLLAGAVVTETIFAWPGIGRLLVQAIGARDYPLVQGCVLAVASSYVAVNLLTDLLQALVDPRLRERA
ncbi:ABC transporter permease [Candidatus Binatia bacterium]|jgi:peptide/nickel transport system permease protein|nr:ABC transporter permease [Candidatus Binatia bacterium]